VLAVLLYRRLSPLRATLLVMVGCYLLLPLQTFLPPGTFGQTKVAVSEFIVLAGTITFGRGKVKWPRPSWWASRILRAAAPRG
jgi:hypothetical protein